MIRLFGFDVKINLGFVAFVGIIVFLYPGAFGFWFAGMLTLFTLIHEFGHAVVARHFGAHASISLGFMAGYTSFAPTHQRPLSPMKRAAISLAGPAVHILTSFAVLIALQLWSSAQPGNSRTALEVAVWWAGPVIGTLNLIPVLPLDGGHLVQHLLTALLKRDVIRPMAIASLVVTIAAAVYMRFSGMRSFTVFVVFLVFSQLQIVQATSKSSPTRHRSGTPMPSPTSATPTSPTPPSSPTAASSTTTTTAPRSSTTTPPSPFAPPTMAPPTLAPPRSGDGPTHPHRSDDAPRR